MFEASTPVVQALRQYFQVAPEGTRRCILATSGGPDSQALLDGVGRLTEEFALQPLAVGIDHGLRLEAAAELALAERLSGTHGVPFKRICVTLPRGGNLLAQARLQRYRALARVAGAWGAQAVLTAHTRNDQAETVLFHLVRGTSLRGAGGMAPRRGRLHRPLLAVSREEILAHLQAYGVSFASDPSNQHPARSRTQLRHAVLPALQQINSQAVRNISSFATAAHIDNALLERMARRLLRRSLRGASALCCATVSAGHEALWPRVLRQWLRPLGGQPDGHALVRLLRTLGPGAGPLPQGAMKGCTVRKRGDLLVATPTQQLPERRSGE